MSKLTRRMLYGIFVTGSMLKCGQSFAVGNPCDQLQFFSPSTPAQSDLLNTCSFSKITFIPPNSEVPISVPGPSTLFPSEYEQLVPFQALAQTTLAFSVANQQFRNVKNRLMLLRRGGGRGIDISGLSGNSSSQLPLSSLSQMPGYSSGGASGDTASSFDKLGIFMNGNFGVGDKNATSRELGFNYDSQGVTAGIDYRFTDNFVLGGTFGYNAVKSDFDASRGNLNLDGYSFSLFSTYYNRDFYLDTIFSGGWNDYDTRRNLNFGGINQTGKSLTQGNDYSFNISSGYDFHHQSLSFGPYGRVSYQNVQIDGFHENAVNPGPGFGSLAMVGKQNAVSLQTAMGGQLSYALSTSFGVLMPTARAEWVHEFNDGSRQMNWQFSNDPNQTAFSIASDGSGRNFANLGAGLTATFTHGTSAFLYYEAMVGRANISEHSINAGVRAEF